MKVWNTIANNKIIDETFKKAKEKTKKALFGQVKESDVKRKGFDIDYYYLSVVRQGLKLAGVIKVLESG